MKTVRRRILKHIEQFFFVDSQREFAHNEFDVTIARHAGEGKDLRISSNCTIAPVVILRQAHRRTVASFSAHLHD